ncbi:MAG: DUF3540 domain-containing protein [Polyangiaceae bacterium]
MSSLNLQPELLAALSSAETAGRRGPELFLGPARVVAMEGATPIVELDGQREHARLALAFPYAPAVDDVLLVLGRTGALYVVGILEGRGELALRFLGDVKLHAVGGKLELEGDQGVRVRGAAVEIVTRQLKTLADSVVERANDVYRRVRDTLSVHAGEKRVLVDGALSTRAASASTATSGVVTINGKEIHLG